MHVHVCVCECVDRVVQGRLPTWLPEPVSRSFCPQKWCVWGGSGISKCYRFKSLFNKWTPIIIVTIKAQNHWWNLTTNMTSSTYGLRKTGHYIYYTKKWAKIATCRNYEFSKNSRVRANTLCTLCLLLNNLSHFKFFNIYFFVPVPVTWPEREMEIKLSDWATVSKCPVLKLQFRDL